MSNSNTNPVSLNIGIMAIQGAFSEHKIALTKATKEYGLNKSILLNLIEVREVDDLQGLDGLIIPGGESTTMSIFLESNGLTEALRTWIKEDENRMVWGTCAGLILMSNEIEGQKQGGQAQIGGLDILTSRNFFGRQLDSFESYLDIKDTELQDLFKTLPQQSVHGVFIRAPAVLTVNQPDVKILATVNVQSSDKPVIVGVAQRNLMATAFHPELTDNYGWHAFFLQKVLKAKMT